MGVLVNDEKVGVPWEGRQVYANSDKAAIKRSFSRRRYHMLVITFEC